MGTNLLIALALVLVIEGLLPFISPRSYRSAVEQLSSLPDQSLRGFGLAMMVLGVVLLYVFH